ncbi:MAG TPA: DUF3826 domain-containing protein [Verrucomicrobiae bacterium]|nr:DUF3826 domain-containing protein [Verrucomicrobiae bacterium]
MKKIIILSTFLLAVPVFAGESNATSAAAEAKYTAVIDERSQKIVDALELKDANTAKKVHEIIMAQYRELNDWHNAHDPEIKAAKHNQEAIAKIEAPLKKLHDEYLAKLGQYLSPAQIETVKDKMTYGKVEFTYKGYLAQYPNLSEENKAEILRMLKEAREQAIDAGSAEEKTAIFQRYKGRINNYLSKQGIHPEKHKPEPAKTNSSEK